MRIWNLPKRSVEPTSFARVVQYSPHVQVVKVKIQLGNENAFPGTQRTNSEDLSTFWNGIKVSTSLYKFASEVHFRQNKFAVRIFNAFDLNSLNLPDETFAEWLVVFQDIIQSLAIFAVGYP